ncbi:unnamed protein product [Meganyctiphanes norvegica]|uniref:Uncharacterized protein n=1 Tax=Meganyctiphanes norvegica TaxID=48144 RepID=A0AAV2QQG9_MEGNR
MGCNPNALTSCHTASKAINLAISITCIVLLLHFDLRYDLWKDPPVLGMENAQMSQEEAVIIREREPIVRSLVGHMALGTSALVSFTMIISYLFKCEDPGLDAILSLAVGCFSIAGGGLTIETYYDQLPLLNNDSDHQHYYIIAGIAMGALMLLNALIFFIDAIVKIRS